MKNETKVRIATWLGQHGKNPLFKRVSTLCWLVNRAIENRNLDPNTNGERWLVQTLGNNGLIHTALDVGANVGDWTLMLRQYAPCAKVHCFEPSPITYNRLYNNLQGCHRTFLINSGLSSRECETNFFHNHNHDGLSSVYGETHSDAFTSGWFDSAYKSNFNVSQHIVKMTTGDRYCTNNNISRVELVKIDVEGGEGDVLKGFTRMLSQHKVRVIQFEYNIHAIASKFLLYDAHKFFDSHGYIVGKLYPNFVDFRKYNYKDENFCGPNMVAILRDDTEMRRLLI